MKALRHAVALLTLSITLSSIAVQAQDYPSRPVRMIVAVGAGGTGDVFARVLGDELLKRWGQPVVIENRPGAQSNIGARACAEAAPDGYTLCIMPGEPLAYNPHLFKKLPFDPAKDFEPISNLFFNFQALVVNAKLNVKTVRRTGRAVEGEGRHLELYGAVLAVDAAISKSSSASAARIGSAFRSRAAAIPPTRSCRARRRSPSSACRTSSRICAAAR